MSIDAGLIGNALSLGATIIGAVSVWYAKRAAKASEDVQANGVTHILAREIPSTPIIIPAAADNASKPVKTIVVDGITYTAKS